MSEAPVTQTVTPIATGAPKHAHDDGAAGYFYKLPLTETPPADASSPAPGTAIPGGFVGEDGPTLTAEIDAEFIRDWNLDQVLQLKQGVTATLEIPVFGWNVEQAKLIYGDDSIIETDKGFEVVWAGELPERAYFVLELAGLNGNGRLVVEGQVQSPGQVQFQKGDALRHTVTVALFKNANFKDAKGRSGYFRWMDESGEVSA